MSAFALGSHFHESSLAFELHESFFSNHLVPLASLFDSESFPR